MSLKTKPARQIPNRNVRLNQFYEFVTNPTLRYRLARHGLMWGVSLFIIYKRFEYNAVLLSSLAERELYINLSTLFFGGLTILDYVLITLLLRELVLRRSQMKLFVLGLIGVHVLTALLVRWNIHWFVDLFNERHIPVAYRTFAEHVTNLSPGGDPEPPGLVSSSPVDGSIWLRVEKSTQRIRDNNILYVKGETNYVMVYLENGKKVLTHMNMAKAEKVFMFPVFIRIHKSYIVRLSAIDKVEGNTVTLSDGTKVFIGPKFREKLKQVIPILP